MAPTTFQRVVATANTWWEGIANPHVIPPEFTERMLTALGSRSLGKQTAEESKASQRTNALNALRVYGPWNKQRITSCSIILKVCFLPR